MATIEKRGNSYRITVYNKKDAQGKTVRITKTYKPDPTLTPRQQEKAVKRFADELEEKIKNGYSLEGDKLTLSDFSERWLDNVIRPTLERPTITNYEN